MELRFDVDGKEIISGRKLWIKWIESWELLRVETREYCREKSRRKAFASVPFPTFPSEASARWTSARDSRLRQAANLRLKLSNSDPILFGTLRIDPVDDIRSHSLVQKHGRLWLGGFDENQMFRVR